MSDFISYAVDFDGTLTVKSEYPNIGTANIYLIDYLIAERIKGNKVILFTCRQGELLDEAIKFCNEKGLHFDAINENLPENIAKYGGDTRKIHADYYIDDRMLWFPSVGMHFANLRCGAAENIRTACRS